MKNLQEQSYEVEEENEAHETVRCAVCLHNKVCVLFAKMQTCHTCGPCSLRVKKTVQLVNV